MKDLSLRTVEVVEVLDSVRDDTVQGFYRPPSKASGFAVKRDTANGPVVSVSIEEYLSNVSDS